MSITLDQMIEEKLKKALPVVYLKLKNESNQHAKGTGDHSHYRVILVSDAFEGVSLIARHRLIYQILKEELEGFIHALAMELFTKSEWEKGQFNLKSSPACLGGSMKEKKT